MKRYIINLSLLIILTLATTSSAVTRYVAKTGSDINNDCTEAQTEGTPKLTIAAGLACTAASDTLIVKSGTYNEVLGNNIPSGAVGNHTIVRSQVQYGAIIQPGSANQGNLYATAGAVGINARSYITFDGFTLEGAGLAPVYHIYLLGAATNIIIQNNEIRNGGDINSSSINTIGVVDNHGPSFITVRNNKIHHMGTGAVAGQGYYSYGIYTHFKDSIIENNEIYNCSGHGIHMYNTVAGDEARNIVRNNRLHHNGLPSGAPGMLVDGGPDNKVYGNVVWANGGHGIQIGGYGIATTNTLVYNNTIHGNPVACIRMGSTYGGPTTVAITNNICYQNGVNGVQISNGSGITQTTNFMSGNPLFVNVGAANYRLLTGSPAINAGTNVTSVVVIDPDGTVPTAPMEQGAYNFGAVVLPNVLVFNQPPGSAVVGTTLPNVEVCVNDTAGARQTAYATNISLAIGDDANPTTVLTGGTGGAPTNGCRAFPGLSLNKTGTGFTLDAISAALTVRSGMFNSLVIPTAPLELWLNRTPRP